MESRGSEWASCEEGGGVQSVRLREKVETPASYYTYTL